MERGWRGLKDERGEGERYACILLDGGSDAGHEKKDMIMHLCPGICIDRAFFFAIYSSDTQLDAKKSNE